ncbi:beta-ketoacyl synthase N-terminal-like domain-containing protein [Colwellia sp. UCD-KL20]|uniref:beta-ketoacyl synthase N-terminal-like domain-containing protein n=1 Tax=Colwellia sp. UCD-KL20 TaxID=1917165 RepID=UPI000970D8D5|nr:beta-ketoacyl synthase N-terminal-like domain-containing protein [Colwellia sp. UCD-KL20]
MNKVFIVASSSISAIGEQKDCQYIVDNPENMLAVDIPAENKSALYFPINKNRLHKTFDEMISLLSSQIEGVIQQANLTSEELAQTVLFLGSTSLDIACVEPDENKSIWLSQTDRISQNLALLFGLHTTHYTFNTACTSSANALLYATKFIKHNKIKHALVIGCEFFNQLSINGFDSLDLFSNSGVRPFSNTRDGLLLGEGAGVLMLSNTSNSSTIFEVLGGYSSCDDFSLTITDENGDHIIEVVEKALANGNINKSDIDLIKIHGTASQMSDLAECNAITRLFKALDNAPEILGFKSFLGHTLGACSVLELALLEHIFQQEILPECTYQKEDENVLLHPFISSAQKMMSSEHILLNHFGFGGNNAAVILKNIKLTSNKRLIRDDL